MRLAHPGGFVWHSHPAEPRVLQTGQGQIPARWPWRLGGTTEKAEGLRGSLTRRRRKSLPTACGMQRQRTNLCSTQTESGPRKRRGLGWRSCTWTSRDTGHDAYMRMLVGTRACRLGGSLSKRYLGNLIQGDYKLRAQETTSW